MDKHKTRRRTAFILLLIMMICFCFSFVSSCGDEQREEKKKPSISEMIKSAFSIYTTSLISRSYWNKLKALMNQAQAYFFPPNPDFRGSEEPEAVKGATGGKEKVKEAVARSLEKSKETVGESAKSAAEIAGKTMKKTKDKFKKSFSSSEL